MFDNEHQVGKQRYQDPKYLDAEFYPSTILCLIDLSKSVPDILLEIPRAAFMCKDKVLITLLAVQIFDHEP